MNLFYDQHDLASAKKLHDHRFEWLQGLGAVELSTASPSEAGFLFAYQNGEDYYRQLVQNRPLVSDRPEARFELIYLDQILAKLQQRGIEVPTPQTWVLGVDDAPPDDLTFPLFVRTPRSSWKRGGTQGRAKNLKELNDEIELLRRAFGWDTPILARQWIDMAVAGKFMFGNAPQEIRVWIVDRQPLAWSFHYLHVVPDPKGFPPRQADLDQIAALAARIGTAFDSRLIAADFIRDRRGKWWFLEAGPGSAAGTAHQAVFNYVAARLRGDVASCASDQVGGAL